MPSLTKIILKNVKKIDSTVNVTLFCDPGNCMKMSIWEPRHRGGIRNVLVALDQVLLRYF